MLFTSHLLNVRNSTGEWGEDRHGQRKREALGAYR